MNVFNILLKYYEFCYNNKILCIKSQFCLLDESHDNIERKNVCFYDILTDCAIFR